MLRSRIASTLARSAAGPSASSVAFAAVPRLARSVQTTADSSSLIDHGEEHVKVKLHEEYFKAHRCEPPSLELEVPKQQLVDIYREMVQFVSPSSPLLGSDYDAECCMAHRMRRMEMAADQVRNSGATRRSTHAPPRTANADPLIVPSRAPSALQGG